MGFILVKQGSRGVQTSGYEQKFPRNASFVTVRATSSANTDRTQKRMQKTGIAGLEDIPLVKSYVAAKLIRMKVHEFSDSTLCVGISHPDQSNHHWATTKLNELWNKHGFDKQLNFSAREVQFNWHVHPGASTLHITKHIQTYLNGGIQNHLKVGS